MPKERLEQSKEDWNTARGGREDHRAGADICMRAVTLGYKSVNTLVLAMIFYKLTARGKTLKQLRSGKAKLVIIAGNTPPLRKV